eukprot:m.22306 g.22306  ORF g.22306 m.22306 type:complete len:783 (+) comp7385_c0_seq1:350-2698(+)
MAQRRQGQQYGTALPENTPSELGFIQSAIRELAIGGNVQSNADIRARIDSAAQTINAAYGSQGDAAVRIIVQSAATYPEQCGTFSTLVGLLNANIFSLGEKVVHELCAQLTSALENREFLASKLLVRFAADLVNASVLHPESLVSLLESLLAVASEPRSPQARGDAYASLVLAAIPWVGRDLAARNADALDALLGIIEEYIKTRKTTHKDMIKVFLKGEKEYLQTDSLELMWRQVQDLRTKGWVETAIPRPYIHFGQNLMKAQQHSLVEVKIPEHDAEHPNPYPLPSVNFCIFDSEQDNEFLPPPFSVERGVFDAMVTDMLGAYKDNKSLCVDHIRRLAIGNPGLSLNHIIVERLLGEFFRLPSCALVDMYYFAVATSLLSRSNVHATETLSEAMTILFNNLDNLDVECQSSFVKWVGHYINYYNFNFKWQTWFEAAKEDSGTQAVFIREVFSLLSRLSYPALLKEAVPAELAGFVPADPKPISVLASSKEYQGLQLPTDSLANIIMTKEKTATDVGKILSMVDGLPQPDQTSYEFDPEERNQRLQLDLLLEALLQVGSKTCSHMHRVIEKMLPLLKERSQTSESKARIIEFVARFWYNDEKMLSFTLDLLFVNKVIDVASLAEWVFSARMVVQFSREFLWKCIFDALDHLIFGVKQVGVKLEKVKKEGNDDEIGRVDREYRATIKTQQKAFLDAFQHLSEVLTDHIARCQQNGAPLEDAWFRIAIGRFKQLGRKYFKVLDQGGLLGNLNRLVFDDMDPVIHDRAVAGFGIFKQLASPPGEV